MLRVVLLGNVDQTLLVRRTVTREDRLEPSGITHVVERIIQASLLGGIVDSIGSVLQPLSDDTIISRSNPFHDLGVAEVDLGRVQSQSVTAAGVGGLDPLSANGLPVQLDGGDVGGGDLGVQLRELVEEGSVDDADSLVELVIGCSLDCSGNEDITIANC